MCVNRQSMLIQKWHIYFISFNHSKTIRSFTFSIQFVFIYRKLITYLSRFKYDTFIKKTNRTEIFLTDFHLTLSRINKIIYECQNKKMIVVYHRYYSLEGKARQFNIQYVNCIVETHTSN